MERKQQQFSIWYFLIAVVVLLAMQNYLFSPHVENLSYSDFKGLLKAGKVEDLTLSKRTISGALKSEGLEGFLPQEKINELKKIGEGMHRFVSVRVDDPSLIQELEEAKIRFAGQVENTWVSTLLAWIFPFILLFHRDKYDPNNFNR